MECLDVELVVTRSKDKFEGDFSIKKLRYGFESANDGAIVILSIFDSFW